MLNSIFLKPKTSHSRQAQACPRLKETQRARIKPELSLCVVEPGNCTSLPNTDVVDVRTCSMVSLLFYKSEGTAQRAALVEFVKIWQMIKNTDVEISHIASVRSTTRGPNVQSSRCVFSVSRFVAVCVVCAGNFIFHSIGHSSAT